MAIVRIQCSGLKQDLWGVSGETAKRLPDPRRLYPWGIAPLGVGLTGRGVEHPPPLSLCQPLDGLRRATPTRPAACAASSRPLQRGRAVIGDSPDTVLWAEAGSLGSFR